jgi:molybdopterin converting factor small subunit
MTDSGGSRVTLRFWAAAREAAGAAEQTYDGVATLADLLAAAVAARGDDGGRLERVLARCSFLVDGDPAGRRDRTTVAVRPGSVVEALPPFAGG